jgi:two-component system, sensor histidine kinase and response regulator
MDPVRILVVDDEPGMRLGVERTLRNFTLRLPDFEDEVTFIIRQATSGEEALTMIEDEQPDLMLLDHKMGGMSGLDVLDALGPRLNEILTVMITAYASLETAVTATKRGAYDFLAKPFTPDELKSTVRKATNHLLLQKQARQLAEEKRQVRFQFISVLAHELKAPIGAIEGYLHLIQDRTAGDDFDAYNPMIDRSIVRLDGMRKLIADLLDLTRLESGAKTRELVEIDLVALATETMETYATQADKRGIDVELHAGGPMMLMGDSGELQIILNNLVSNAVKYNRDDGRVDITMTQVDGLTTLTVTDTGIGMSEEEVQRLFGEFVRIKNAKTRNILGSGLGLSILKRLSQLYGGDVAVASTPDVGTTFTVTLGATQGDNDAT